MSPDVSNTSTTIVSLNFSKNSTQFPVILGPTKVIPGATLIQATNDGMKFTHQSERV